MEQISITAKDLLFHVLILYMFQVPKIQETMYCALQLYVIFTIIIGMTL